MKWDPEKLRDAVERCYIGFGGDMRALIGQLKLVRSWEDPIRTGGWALVSSRRVASKERGKG